MTALTADERAAIATSVAGSLAGQRPPEDDRFRAATDKRDARFVRSLAAEAARQLEGKPAAAILGWATAVVPRFVVTSSFGAESAVLLHLLSRAAPDVPVLFLDTGLHFDQTLRFRREIAARFGLTVLDLRPDLSVAQQAQRHGAALYDRDPDTCCGLRKTMPLRRGLASFDGWATGVRRVQTPERGRTPVVEARAHDGRWLVKVAPLAAWTDADIGSYLDRHDLPRHPLADQGYRSIGCQPCTTPVNDDGDPRAGRWAAFARTECGLHLDGDDDAVRHTTTPG